MEFLTTDQLLSWEPPVRSDIIPNGILYPGCRMIIFGRWQSWKSMLAMHTAKTLASGSNWLGYPTRPVGVALVQVEMTQRILQRRVQKYIANNPSVNGTKPLYWVSPEGLKLDNVVHFRTLEHELVKRKVEVLITDPIYRTISGDMTKGDQVSRWIDNMESLRVRHEIAQITIGHTRKLSTETDLSAVDWGQELFGSIFFENWPDVIIYVHREGRDNIRLEFVKTRDAEDIIEDIRVSINRDTLEFKVIQPKVSTKGVQDVSTRQHTTERSGVGSVPSTNN